jgi:squalene-hopene/tetraprenyl-beta-curcumene cyclase
MYNSIENETFGRQRSQSNNNRLDVAIASAVDWLLDQQDPEGFWVGMLESNSCMEAQWVLAMLDRERAARGRFMGSLPQRSRWRH